MPESTSGSDELWSPGDVDTDESLEKDPELARVFMYSDASRILNGNPRLDSTYFPSTWFRLDDALSLIFLKLIDLFYGMEQMLLWKLCLIAGQVLRYWIYVKLVILL